MLIWCSYCQHFYGEAAPYDNFTITHGICATCEPTVFTLADADIAHARVLKAIQERLFEAGSRSDLGAARRIIEASRQFNVREVDILVGIMAPMLFQIGEDWKYGPVSVTEEHRFTVFCEKVLDLVGARIAAVMPADAPPSGPGEVLLITAPGNRHTLGVRILALWLIHNGMPAWAIDGPLDIEALVALVGRTRPRLLLVSMALAEQAAGIAAIIRRLSALPDGARPRILVGGYAVKMQLVTAIPGADLLTDIGRLKQIYEETSAA